MTRYIFFLMILVLGFTACGTGEDVKKEDILVTIGSKSLLKQDVIKAVPSGLSKDDSIKFVDSYINEWINSKLLSEVASKNIPTMEKINNMVDDYRNKLIMYEYRKGMILSNDKLMNIPEDTIKAYYNLNISNFRLSAPILKGIYIKVAIDAPKVNDVKKWIKSAKREDIDKIEKYGLNGAIHYDYFRDRWVSWSDVEKNIPYNFADVNRFVKETKNFEVEEKGFIYLLNITDYKEKGDIMPFDFARQQIKEIFVNSNQRKFDAQLQKVLYDEAINDGTLILNYKQK
ncbi:MAG: peptidylprolyl isomerase [Muribaculaceae bacterium]